MAPRGRRKRTADATPFNRLYDEYWEFVLLENPTWATYLGDHRYDDRLEDASEAGVYRREEAHRDFLERLRGLRTDGGSGTDQLNREIFERDMVEYLEGARFRPYLLPMNQQGGPHIDIPELTTYHPLTNVQGFDTYIARLRAFPRLVDENVANMRTGVRERIVPARVNVGKIVPQLDAQIVDNPEASDLYKPAIDMASTVPASDAGRIRRELRDAIADAIVPGYVSLRAFVRDEYLPATREEAGIWALPDGKERYAFAVRHHTTTSMTPDAIHDLGRKQLARIHGEMQGVMDRVGFRGTAQEFADKLRADPAMHYPTGAELLAGFKDILRKMDTALPCLFGRLPTASYGFREIEAFRAEAAPDAYYYAPAEDGSRPGYFYVNTHKPEVRPKYTMEALAYHEAVPGHHLQIAIAQELTRLPKFRRYGGFTAFIEGWGLYSERLPKEVGFYADPYQDFGRLTLQAWRAARLVVDTGIHDMRWTREQAIEFFKENTALSEHNIVSEVERYIATPGQALAYMIGRLKIEELRSRAEAKLGGRFDVRVFHDELLGDGALPLDVLERKMDRWLAGQLVRRVPRKRPRRRSRRRTSAR